MRNEASHGETKNAHGNIKSAHQEEEKEKIVDERTQVLHAAMASGKSFECTDGIEAEDTSVFDLWKAAGHDCAPDMEWYIKQTVLGAVYTTTELYMLTDYTPRCKT
ncbi:unnamed protein product [Sphagnum jensenii]|uniref:COQ9 C-terminal domain-containing protein n=1 Tax=Sphagnum jensenii TaxID=128206 RepID=A0ABP1AA48_9BRYO